MITFRRFVPFVVAGSLASRLAAAQTAPTEATAPAPTAPPPTEPTAPAPTAPAPSQAPPATPPPPAPAAGSEKPASSASLAAAAGMPIEPMLRYANTWDLNLEGGGGYVTGDVGKWTGFVRARPGVLIIRNDNFYQAGVTAEYITQLKRPAFGVQAEYLHLQLGVWLQVGAEVDTKGRPGGMAALGLSVLGVEAQVRQFDGVADPSVVLLAKLRIPVGIIAYAIRTK